MKSTLLLFLFPLFSIGVFCTDVKEPVSVMVGDSVTLHINTKIHAADVIVWSFGQKTIAMIDEGSIIITTSDENLKDRLQLVKQTGDLKIRNIKTTDSGDYKLDITRASRTEESVTKTFGVSVATYPVGEKQSVLALLGESVTLHTDATDLQKYDLIQWKFEQHFIANISRMAGNISTSDGADGEFRHRLQLEYLTGSLTIKNIGKKYSGLYEVDIISSNKHTIHKTFNVTVSGEMRSLSVMKADSVTLNTYTNLQTYDVMLWRFANIFIAEIHKATQLFYTYDGRDERFRNRLKINNQTGSLTITNLTTEHTGVYDLKISSSRHTIHKRISVTVNELKTLSVIEGKSVTLPTETEIQQYDLIMWKCGDTLIAETNRIEQRFSTYDGPDERFRDRLKLDNQTGSLTITETRTTDSGLYDLKISSSRHTVHKRIIVTVTPTGLSPGGVAGIVVLLIAGAVAVAVAGMIYYRRKISTLERKKMDAITVTEECPVCLPSDVTEIQTEDVIQWMFRDEKSPIAKIEGQEINIPGGADGRFRGRLQLDHQTGSLTITNTRITDSGDYELLIIRSGIVSKKSKKFSVTVSVEAKSVTEGGSVILKSKAEIQRDDQMLLLFGEQEICIGQIKGGTEEFSTYDDVPDDRFKGRLELNKKTRSVNITNTSTKDSGLYKLLIIGSGTVTSKIFSVTVSGNTASGRNGQEEQPLMGVDVSNSRL